MSKASSKMDAMVASDLGLSLSPITMTLKHARGFTQLIKGFVFAYIKDDIVYYDTVKMFSDTNGMRQKIPKFISQPVINKRLEKREYRRWYVCCRDTLYPVQTAKYMDLFDNFYFLTDNDPRYRTQTATVIEETQYIRKKPLVAMRPMTVGWGVFIDRTKQRKLVSRPKMAIAT